MEPQPFEMLECVVCRRLICDDAATCRGELSRLCDRIANRDDDRPERNGVRA